LLLGTAKNKLKDSIIMKKYFFRSVNFLVLPFLFLTQELAMAGNYVPKITPGDPLVVIIDNSGSMGECPETDSQGKCKLNKSESYRIDDVKKAIGDRITQPDMVSTKISLVELGNYKEYGQTKAQSCQAVSTLLPVGVHDISEFDIAFKKIKPNGYGATPLTFAIESVASNLEKNNLLPARMLIVTDGKPNCNEGYLAKHICRLFGSFDSGHIDVKIDIIGYKARDQDSEFVECAKKHPGILTYLGSPNNIQDLGQTIDRYLPHSPISAPPNGLINPIVLAAIIGGIATIIAAYINKGFLLGWIHPKKRLIIQIFDRKTNKKIKNASVTLWIVYSADHPTIIDTNAEGICEFQVKDINSEFKIEVDAESYEYYDIQFTPSKEGWTKNIKLTKSNPLQLPSRSN
jgi:hypothetical protein